MATNGRACKFHRLPSERPCASQFRLSKRSLILVCTREAGHDGDHCLCADDGSDCRIAQWPPAKPGHEIRVRIAMGRFVQLGQVIA